MADAMAASSGGVDWSSVLKPLLSANYESSNKAELLELCSAIIKSESEILRHKESNENFFNSFAVIAADYIGSNTAGLLSSQLETINAACKVLLKYLLNVLHASCSESNSNSSQIERYVNAIRVLCIGTGLLSTSEVTVLVDNMKGENMPQHATLPPTGIEKDTSNKQDNSKNRSDLSVSIFEQLTLPLRDGHTTTHDQGASSSNNISEISNLNDPTSEINKLFLKGNTESLQSLRAGDTLIDLCLNLSSIKKARLKVEDALAGKPFSIPSNHAEATALRNGISSMLSEIKLAISAMNLPVLEPLTLSKLDKLCSLAMAILHCALSQAVASAVISMSTVVSPKCSSQQSQAGLKEDDLDSNAVSLVEEVLNMYTFIGNTIKTSTRAGGHVYQNYLLAGAWVLTSGLQTHLAATTSSDKNPHLREREEKGRSPCKSRDSTSTRSGLQKFQQSFGVLSVALATRALGLISELFEDLHLEVCGGAGSVVQVEPALLAIMGQFSALQRVARILSAAPLNHLLFYLAIVSYRKACTLKRLHPPEGDTFSQSDSTTYYEDMIMCSDESSTDEDDDSEPILGQWFEETLAPPEKSDPKSPSSSDIVETKAAQNERIRSVVPEKGEAHGYITLATNIFHFMNKHFLCSKSNFIARYVKNGLTEQQMIILSAILRDLDKETARTETGTIPAYFGAVLGQLYCEFSGALMRFTHNLITNNNLATLQACLLNHLGVSPWNTDVPHGWPLQVYPRTLAVLAQVLLLRPQNEKEASVISIWHRLVNTLIENVLNSPQTSTVESENDDLNVEHAQVLLYLFHSLNLMQKKSVVLLMAGGVLRCSEVARGPLKDAQLLHLSRLLLLFDYIMKHLYDAPTSLLEQIQWNLFQSTNLNANKEHENGMSRIYSAWQDIEENYRKISAADEFAMKPRFYVLTTLENNNQDAPKLDGLACNFIQGTPDKLRYPLLLDALIEILNITHVTSGPNAAKMSFLGLCATQYCFMICWRLLQLLPPSASYMERLTTGENLAIGPLLLHSLIWGPRASHKNFSRWLKDCLVKQGMYTQHTDKLLKAVSEAVNTVKYDINNAKNSIIALTPDVKKGLVTKENLPPLWHLYLLDSLLAKVQISVGEPDANAESASIYVLEGTHVQDLLPHVLRLTQAILHCLRWSVLHNVMNQSDDSSEKLSLPDFEGIQDVLAIASNKNILTNSVATELINLLPSCINSAQLQTYKPILDEVSLATYQNDIIPSDTFILKVIDAHISTLSKSSPFSINLSLKQLLQSLTKFICDHAPKAENTDTKNKAIEMLVSITLDLRTEYLYDVVTKTLDKMIGDTETDEHQKRVYLRVLNHTYKLITSYTSPNSGTYGTHINEEVLHHCLKFYEKLLEKSSGRQALESFFVCDKDLVKVLMSVSSSKMSQQYSTRVLHFFNKLFQAADKSSTDPSLNYLCSSMSKIANVDSEKLQIWLRQIIIGSSNILLLLPVVTANESETPSSNGSKWTIATAESKENSSCPTPNEEQKSLVQENSQLLQSLTSFIVKQNSNVSEDVSVTILKALIKLGKHLLSPTLEGVGFTELMVDMTMLADAGSGKGHSFLFPATVEWIEICCKRILPKETNNSVSEEPELTKPNSMLAAATCIIEYISEVITSITFQLPRPFRAVSPPWECESPLDIDFDSQDFTNEDDESGDDSDEDSLCNKLCTFTVTQKEFMNQHWYHCHTCRMLDGVGVCSICARVCHKGHDLSYAKYGNFFCDCGAKEEGSCQALVKRSPQSVETNQGLGIVSSQPSLGFGSEQMLPSSLRRRSSSPIPSDKVLYNTTKTRFIVKQLEGSKKFIIKYLASTLVSGNLLEFLQSIIPAVEETCRQHSPVGCHIRGVKALEQLHYNNEKKYAHTDQLMVPTLGSQEGAFENVRMSYAGEQGQTIRQLLSAHIVRRVAMCCMTSTQGRRQHLAVSHEKGKITVLQLSALLKQADSSTRKLTLTRLSTAPIPFTVISLSSNLCNEDFLVVCGLKDCHVLTFTSGGSVSDHLVLHPQLETGNFIIKALWLPGSQTELALVTADFVKIYDLAVDALSPQYFFLVPSGKIRDCTFMYAEGVYHILLMSSPGHIYIEVLNEDSSTKYGTFYVTNTLDLYHLDITDVNGQVAGGGVSIYYSHTLGLLFYSYAQGKSYISPISPNNNTLPLVFPINLPVPNNTTSKSNGSRNSTSQPLCQWTEIPNHPGLICCAMQSSNNPVILMLKPDSIMIQEIRVVPSKSKIMDMVAIRHSSGNELRTTLILLCEDGSLKMYMANMEQTGFWMSRCIQAALPSTSLKPKKKKVVKSGQKSSNNVTFPVDFFENCVAMNDIELGGNDLLQIYNQAQLKHRLNTTGLYVACNKPLGFSVEITNNDSNMVLTGLRVLIGSQDILKCPSFVEIFGRIVPFSANRSRWYDIPFSREESLQADKKLTILFGPSQDSETVTMVDNLKVFGKTKDSFGWPEETDENVSSGNQNVVPAEGAKNPRNTNHLTKLEKLVVGILESLEGTLLLHFDDVKLSTSKLTLIKVATQLLTLPTQPSIQVHSKSLLSVLHNSRQSYYNYKDQAILQHVLTILDEMTSSEVTDLDSESYYRIVMLVRGIAVSRPQNLIKFFDTHTSVQDIVIEDPLEMKQVNVKELKAEITKTKNQHLLLQLMDILWILHSLNPEIPALSLVVSQGLRHTEQVIHAIVDIVHAFNSCDTYSNITIGVYLQLLLCEDPLIAFNAKHALSKAMKSKSKKRKVYIPTPPFCGSPTPKNIETDEATASAVAQQPTREDIQQIHEQQYDVDAIEAIGLLEQPDPAESNRNVNSLEALLGGGIGFPPLLDIPPDADDEAMVELAIALSLQEHDIGGDQNQALQCLQVRMGNDVLGHHVGQSAQAQEVANLSDTTASAAGSDDEGSTAATDGSTLRTSPAEQGGSGGSESGGSGVESITGEHNVSGRSSAYGDNMQEAMNLVSRSDTSSIANTTAGGIPEQETVQPEDIDMESESSARLHVQRLQLLEKLIEYLPKLRNVNGTRVIPFLQVVLQLTAELDGTGEREKACLTSLLKVIVTELQLKTEQSEDICTRTKQREVQLVLLRMLSIYMQRCKSTPSTKASATDNSNFISRTTATILHEAGIIEYCNKLLLALLPYWRNLAEENSNSVSGNLLKEHLKRPPPDMTPFFQRQFVKDNHDVFQTYPQLLTEIALRLPYQVHRHSEISESINSAFDVSWYNLLCDYMMTPQTPFVRRQVRKLLMFICGNKETYRQLRDLHGLKHHMKGVKECCIKGGYQPTMDVQHDLGLTYDSLVELIEHLKYCVDVAQSRTGNWQRFCLKEDGTIQFLLRVSFLLDDGVAPTILQLLQSALVFNSNSSKKAESLKQSSRKDREKSEDSNIEARFEEASGIALVGQINNQVSREVFARFVKTFMLETNITSVRWQAHALVQSIYRNSSSKNQESLLELLWQLWPLLPAYGRKAAQFVDLLGYFSLKFTETPEGALLIPEYVERAVGILRAQNEMLAHHPNANLYAHMSQFVDLDGYYLESEPCLVCNNPEVPFSTIKLSSIKVDSKFTTTTQIVKLLSSHTISKITIRIADLKRTKMVRTVNIYYNNRTVQAVVELKNKPALWHKAKKVTLQSGQTEVKIEFPLPIIACNLMVEYSEFYENIQASSETLQCPRCSASVPANPGVCANCGENVFQCHKCRAINYDEKDPFLCHACGFCKYAKFDFSLYAKPCCAVEPIENDEDRKKTVASINALLEKADRVYKQLIANKPNLETLVLRISEHRSDKRSEDNVATSNAASNATANSSTAGTQLKVNKTIQLLGQQYCIECKTSFEELSKIIQKVMVSRKELVAYDRKHRNMELPKSTPVLGDTSFKACNRCYGCSTSATEHSLTLLRALAHNPTTRLVLCQEGLIQELVWNNLRKGTVHNQEEVRQLLCVLTKDNSSATEELCALLMERITLSLNGHVNSSDLGTSVRHEIALLAAMVQKEDECWELKLRCMMRLFLKACEDSRSPLVMESVILPCLKILQGLMKPLDNSNNGSKDKGSEPANHIVPLAGTTVDVHKFLENDPRHTFDGWKARLPGIQDISTSDWSREGARVHYLKEKYGRIWRRTVKKTYVTEKLTLHETSWLKAVIFNPSSRLARQVSCNIIEVMCSSFERKREILNLLTHFLLELSVAGESSAEFLALYQNLIQEVPWKQYLTVHGVLLVLAHLVTIEIEKLHKLEETTLTSDLAQGYALNQLTELLSSFLDDATIRRQYKGRLVGAVLNGYLSLRRLVVQRTRLIDETQEKLLELLEEMTSGTEEETKAFMSICIKTVGKYSLQDILTPVFIFERLCSIIYPEENDVGEFFLTLEKDPQQEDFLQGRMLGNPYSSVEAGLGPLMRDVKNKICQDCELVALLEDDNGMELLVNNKIMSLDLPVKDVYKKVWLAEGGDHEAMRVIYRMRGLLGDATEEFIESLNNNTQCVIDNEDVFKMANVLAYCGGLQMMVIRLGAIRNVYRARPLLQVLLKLFRLCIKVNRCQEVLIQPEIGAMEVFLRTLKLCLDSDPDSSQAAVTEQLLDIMETILSKATSQPFEKFKELSHTFGSPEYVKSLLTCTNQSVVKNNIAVQEHLTRVLAALVYGNEDKMKILVDHFNAVLDFNKYDYDHDSDDQQKLEMFCVLTNGIEKNAIGNTFKDYIISLDIVKNALEYITMHAPCVKPTLLRVDSDELKDFISKPALKYVLRFLTGLAHSHEKTQVTIAAADTISIIHRLEQVSSDEHVGSLAENLLEALCTNDEVAKQIDVVRDFTRSEKKRLAMAMREKQLGQLGMRTNDKGQVTAKSTILQQIEELGEESGLVCCICREGYKYQPTKVLGLYTFTKRCNIEEFEAKARKTVGYSTVTHFNIVHIDCHMSAVRLARARDEWESAALQNANTKCNGLLPLWGPQVPESAYASCLARHNTYLQESTNHRDIGHSSTVHDLKILLMKFALEKPFHEDTGGGGPQSNMHMVPYLVHVALYVINTTRVSKREEASLMSYLESTSMEKWVESAYESEGPLYWATMSILLHSFAQWTEHRIHHLRRLIIVAHARQCHPSGPVKTLSDKIEKSYSVYKPYLVFFGLVDGIYNHFFKNVSSTDEQWPNNLADYIRHNDEALLKSSEKLLTAYTDDLLPCTSFIEFCDVTGLLDILKNPDTYISDLLSGIFQ